MVILWLNETKRTVLDSMLHQYWLQWLFIKIIMIIISIVVQGSEEKNELKV